MQTPSLLDLGEKPDPPQSVRAKTRDALHAMVMDSLTGAEAARAAGLGTNTLSKAMQRPDVQEYVKALQTWKDKRETIRREGYLPLALDEALRLAQGAKSESVRMRAIEFLHHALAPRDSDGKPAPVVNLTQNISPSYAYSPPPDTTTAPSDPQAIEGKAQSLDDS
jgi:hypothetical protein